MRSGDLARHAGSHNTWHKKRVMGAHQTGMRWPHHSCRETHQSRMPLSHMLYTFSKRSGTMRMSPSATACSPLLKGPCSVPLLGDGLYTHVMLQGCLCVAKW